MPLGVSIIKQAAILVSPLVTVTDVAVFVARASIQLTRVPAGNLKPLSHHVSVKIPPR